MNIMPQVLNPSNRPLCDRNFSYEDGAEARNLYGSCVPLALAAALGISYKHATKWVLKHGGGKLKIANGKEYVAGAHTARHIKNYMTKLGREGAKLYNTPRYSFLGTSEDLSRETMPTNCKLSTFVKNNPTGRFIVLVAGHAVAVVNGQIFDNNEPYGAKNYNVKFAIELGTKK